MKRRKAKKKSLNTKIAKAAKKNISKNCKGG